MSSDAGPAGASASAAEVSPAESVEIVRADGMNKWFHRGRSHELHVLKDVDVGVRKGEVLVVIGPSGSGKSTLLRCLNFLAPAETGTVTFLGETLSAERLPRLSIPARLDYERRLRHFRTQMGMVFQHFHLFPHMTVLDNVAAAPIRVLGMPKQQARERAAAELERVGMSGKSKRLPEPALRRSEAARRDRACARDEAEADALRRGDLGARPGADRRHPRRDAQARRGRDDDDRRHARDGIRARGRATA